MLTFTREDTQCPGFNWAMEFLASIPPEPYSLPLASLVGDFNFDSQAAALDIIKSLREVGYEVCVTDRPGRIIKTDAGRAVYIARRNWKYAARGADEYLEEMWEHSEPSAAAPLLAPAGEVGGV